MSLEEIKAEYVMQDTRFTAFPCYVMVQELVMVGIIEEGYGVNCPYGDGVTQIEYVCDYDHELYFRSEEELNKFLKENKEYTSDDFNEINVGYIWHPVEFFLTVKGAKEYMRANKHNHGELRTYIGHFERRNFEMRELLDELGFKEEGMTKAEELGYRLQFLVNYLNDRKLLCDGCFTFPDGVTYYAESPGVKD